MCEFTRKTQESLCEHKYGYEHAHLSWDNLTKGIFADWRLPSRNCYFRCLQRQKRKVLPTSVTMSTARSIHSSNSSSEDKLSTLLLWLSLVAELPRLLLLLPLSSSWLTSIHCSPITRPCWDRLRNASCTASR